jgi:glucose-6-phosphate isomerase
MARGLFPVLLGYSTDLHSVGQMVQDGHRNIIETFLVVNKAAQKLRIEADAGRSRRAELPEGAYLSRYQHKSI